MSFIYVITNQINGKQYVGQTQSTIEKRWKEHRQSMYRKVSEKRPLYEAMKKYDVKNFKIELLEEVEDYLVSEKEIYYINKLQTYSNGYNASTGGDGKSFITLEEKEQYLNKFLELKSIKEVSLYFGRDRKTISNYLKSKGIDVYQFRPKTVNPQFHSKKIRIEEFDVEFNTITDAAKYIVENNITQASVNSVHVSIGRVLSGKRKSYLGLNWKQL